VDKLQKEFCRDEPGLGLEDPQGHLIKVLALALDDKVLALALDG